MPRKAKPQPIQTPAGQAYGVAGEQKAAMQAIPLPDAAMATASGGMGQAPVPPQASAGPAPAQAAPAPVDPMEAAVQAALAMTPPSGSISDPTRRPDEPLTQGLPSGPGAGPEVLNLPISRRPTPTADAFDSLARNNPNSPVLAQLAAEARLRGV